MTDDHPLHAALAGVPAGRWVVGVSGGADSVALLRLSALRHDLSLHVAHLNHQTRGQQNVDDADFVRNLCASLAIPCALAQLSDMPLSDAPANASARYRAGRMAFFRQVVRDTNSLGVLLAHHADDQAETVLRRLLREADPAGLVGIQLVSQLNGLAIHRPLLGVRSVALRCYLQSINQPWREDPSNASPVYERNRLRAAIAGDDAFTEMLLQVASAAQVYADWINHNLPAMNRELRSADVQALPDVLARAFIRRWLESQGAPRQQIDADTIDRVLAMARDAAAPARMHVVGGIQLARKAGVIRSVSGRQQ